MTKNGNLNRRSILKITSLSTAGILFSLYLGGCEERAATPSEGPVGTEPQPTTQETPGFQADINIYVRIDSNGQITIMIPRPDIGQGSRTAMAMIVADEMGANWDDVTVEQAPPDPRYFNQTTGGSLGISDSYRLLREGGAVVREVLLAAAAQKWGVESTECTIEQGVIQHAASGQVCEFKDVLEIASEIDPPESYAVELKDPSEFNIIGTSIKRIDAPEMVRGQFQYASDLQLEDMVYAVVKRPPVFSGTIRSYNESSAMAVDGVLQVVEIARGLAVIATSTWAALQGRDALEMTWDEGSQADLSSAAIRQQLWDRAVPAGWSLGTDAAGSLSAVYEVPFFAHASLEPMVCIAHKTQSGCEVWAPTQNPQTAQQAAARAAGVSQADLKLHVMVSGGGFGRRLQMDFIREAAEISSATDRPVKLIWSRQDDIQHDYYHPLSVHYLEADLTPPSRPRITSRESDDIPTGPWRSVENFTQAFVQECFIDEMAAVLDRDPLELRLEIEPTSLHPVLQRAASEAGWYEPLPEGWARGIACHSTWDVTPVAQVAEVSLSPEGTLKVERIVCAIDCGLVINPNMVREQMEGGIAFGLSAALKGAITLEAGRVQQSNFHDYPILPMPEMPSVEVHILESDRDPSGVGEMGVPPAAPAVLNAIYHLTGERVRRLPLQVESVIN
jgi:isoquinoline 1-oxidoreductase beta subunit